MSNLENRERTKFKRTKPNANRVRELLSDSSLEASPEKSPFSQNHKFQRSQQIKKNSKFEMDDHTRTKTITRTNTRGLSTAELESDSIYKEKLLGLELKELSGGESASQRYQSTLIDKEVKGKLRTSLALPRKDSGKHFEIDSNLALSEDRGKCDSYPSKKRKFPFPDAFKIGFGKRENKTTINEFENIDEESGEVRSVTQQSKTVQYSHQENQLREAFIENLREMVTGMFMDLKLELQNSLESHLQKIVKDKERVAVLKESLGSGQKVPEEAKEVIKIQEQMLTCLGNLLGWQQQQNNNVKRMLIDTLTSLDKQVLEVNKIRRVMNHCNRQTEGKRRLKSTFECGHF